MEENPSSSSRTTDRKLIERNRRYQMKALYSKLNSLVPHQSPREAIPLPDQLEEATSYIKKLQMKLEKMKEKKDSLIATNNQRSNFIQRREMIKRSKSSPRFEILEVGTIALQVVLRTESDSEFSLTDIIRLLHEEGVDIVTANYTVVEDVVIHTIHCEVEESVNVAAMISERLKRL
ncbi:transcription factor bHLH162-like [Neltuma alba]|uniref:transcription factor bHLH162-like n=1 Tax=Neltuma alba TaxID=207710 RepID=UPI0010A2E023|nr:transcription factor bHLH162-like [Prosopis alba]